MGYSGHRTCTAHVVMPVIIRELALTTQLAERAARLGDDDKAYRLIQTCARLVDQAPLRLVKCTFASEVPIAADGSWICPECGSTRM